MTLLGFVHAETKTTGRPQYNPADLLKLHIYGYLNSICSNSKNNLDDYMGVDV
jgi:transposase